MDPPARCFPPPWKAVRIPGEYKVEDANDLTVDEARRIAVGVARLPELMRGR